MPKGTSLENLAYKVIEGDKDAAKELMMSISEHIAYDDEGNLMSPKEIAENIVAAEEEPPPRVPTGVKGIDKPTRRESPYEYRQEGREQVREGEAQRLAENISLLKKKSDMQDVLMKIAAEDKYLAKNVGELLVLGGTTLTGAALAVLPGLRLGGSLGEKAAFAAVDAGFGGSVGAVAPLAFTKPPHAVDVRKEREATEKYRDIELSPDAQKLYDEYKAKGFSPTLKYQESPE